MDQFSKSHTKVSRSAINLKIVIFIRFCMADKACAFAIHAEPYKIEISKMTALHDTLVDDWKLVQLLILFRRVLFIGVFDQTLVEHLYWCDKLSYLLGCLLVFTHCCRYDGLWLNKHSVQAVLVQNEDLVEKTEVAIDLIGGKLQCTVARSQMQCAVH